MEKSFIHRLYQSHQSCPACPSPQEITQFFDDLLGGLFADRMKLTHLSEEQLAHYFDELQQRLENILTRSKVARSHEATIQFFDALPSIFDSLQQDVVAMFEGDPAAKSKNEVIRTYPGFYAIAAYRVAHQLHWLGAAGIPRIITEHAHSKTGIDIHPAARIGKHFCIDHGTGIVIGETTVIGDHVKIYQGVTLGALSVNKEDAEKKRHPTIEDHVVIYSGATILGGETTIGHHSVIGGNVWLTRSLPPHSKVYYQSRVEADDAGGEQKLIWKQA
ncbi:MAG: serine O-acetyltransferase [Bacteroidota bacterium]